MPDPTKYTRGYSFDDWASANPSRPLPGSNVDVELDNIAEVTNDLVEAVKDVRRSDGKLQSASVDYGALDPVLQAALAGPILETDPDFPTRASFILFDHSAYADGTIKRAGAHLYQKVIGATTLADKPDWVPLPPYALSQWGVVGDGTTQSAKAQAAVTFCANALLVHDVKAACLGTVVTIAKPIRIEAPTYGDDTSSSSQPTNPAFGFVALTAGMTMIRVISATASNRLYGVHLKGFAVEGENLAAKGVHFSSVTDSGVEDIWAERFRDKAVQFDDGNGGELSNGNYVRGYRYQCGTNAEARKGLALHIDRDATVGAQGHTKFTIERVQAETPQAIISSVADNAGTARFTTTAAHNFQIGDVVYIYDSAVYKARDVTVTAATTTTFDTAQAYVSTDTGRVTASPGCYFAEIDNSLIDFITSTVVFFEGVRGSGARAVRKLTVDHLAGHAMFGAEAIVTILNINSEPSSVTLYASTCAVQYQVTDRVNGAVYQTRKYEMTDNRFLPISAALLSATGTGTLGGASIPVVTFPDSGTPTATWFFAAPPEWDNGTVNAVLHFSGGASGNMYLTTNIATPVLGGGGVGAWDATVTQAVPFAATAGDNTANLALNHTFTRGDGVFLQISRDAANGSDTSAAAFTILGVDIVYVSNGPNGAGANRYGIPVMRF